MPYSGLCEGRIIGIMLTAQADLFYRFGVALIIGILIGMERERAAELRNVKVFAGVRTIALLALAGCTGGLLSEVTASPWPLVAVITILGGLIIAAYTVTQSKGTTSEVAAFVALLCGALCYWEFYSLAGAIGVVVTLLLSFKTQMHSLAHNLSAEDLFSTLKFAAITVIILPLLPDRTFGPPPFDVLNPHQIWLMVVFVSAISFLGYVLMKVVNVRNGITLTGLLGGLVSSTAVTLSFGRRSKTEPTLSVYFAIAITIAWAIMFLRVLVQIAVLNPGLLKNLWLPFLLAALLVAAYAAFLYWRNSETKSEVVPLVNPFELRPALTFGAIYALILVLSRGAQIYFGEIGIYFSSALAGLADVNAITLSMAQLSSQPGALDVGVAAEAVVIAILANTLVRTLMVYLTGAAALRRFMWPTASLTIVVTIVAALWLRTS
jgi:uncharacterized membrane protein (DUF4010 family)